MPLFLKLNRVKQSMRSE
ncbi:hypothetical protein KZ403_10495, partial [Glaesserella parasuis]|nr:hypothetical protein [Glaesserella parasuis]